MMEDGEARALVVGEKAFQACGRPSIKRLARTLAKTFREGVIVC